MSYKKYIAAIAGMSPLCPLMEMRHKMPRILFYHGVTDRPYYDRRVQANQIQFNEFERQMRYLNRNYKFISIDEFYEEFVSSRKFTGKELVLTFDDGYKNNLTVAAPLLNEMNIPFTVFISTALVDKQDFVPTYYVRSAVLSPKLKILDLDSLHRQYILQSDAERMRAMNEIIRCIKTQGDYAVRKVIEEIECQLGNTNREEIDSHFASERIMSWDDAAELQGMGAIIGSHSEDHSVLHDNQDTDEIKRQLRDSHNKIANHLGQCKYFAFPNGDDKSVCKRSLQMASETYKMSFAVTGKSVSYENPINFVARIGAAFNLNMLKAQLSILA